MAKHNETGVKGEELALHFIRNKGYEMLHCNWRFGHKEIDIIALHGDIVVFIEIKTRSGTRFGFPEESVSAKKLKLLSDAALVFMEVNPQYQKMRFDVISIVYGENGVSEIIHLTDILY